MGSRNAASNQGNSRSSSSAAKKGAGRTQGLPTKEQAPRTGFVDGSMREDLIGIALAVIGIALFVAVIVPGNAMLTVAISDALKHAASGSGPTSSPSSSCSGARPSSSRPKGSRSGVS